MSTTRLIYLLSSQHRRILSQHLLKNPGICSPSFRHRLRTNTFSSSKKTENINNEDDDDSKAWIPPAHFKPRDSTSDTAPPFKTPNLTKEINNRCASKSSSVDDDADTALWDDDDESNDEEIDDWTEEDEEYVNQRILEIQKWERDARDGDQFNLDSVIHTKSSDAGATPPDWLRTRRENLGTMHDMMTPEDARLARQIDGAIEVKHLTLLTAEEIVGCLFHLGGRDVRLIVPTHGDLNIEGFVFATGSSKAHLRVMADSIAKALRERELGKMGVVGATHGVEGRDTDDWMIVDCCNYVVQVMDAETREDLDLEGKWGGEEVVVDFGDEDACDDYIMNNPVPDRYARKMMARDDVKLQLKEWKKAKWRESRERQESKKRSRGKKRRSRKYS